MSTAEIEHGIPIPPKYERDLADEFPQLKLLGVGDSFVISKFDFPLHVVIAEWGLRNGQRHEVRRLKNGDYRVWRTQ
jgi:hypothetical protein